VQTGSKIDNIDWNFISTKTRNNTERGVYMGFSAADECGCWHRRSQIFPLEEEGAQT